VFYARWLPLGLLMTAGTNLILTLFLPMGSQPVRLHSEGTLTYLVHTEQPSVDRRFAFYLELDDATEGGELVVPVDSFVDPDLAEGFAGFVVIERSYDPRSLPEEVTEPPSLGEVETDDGDLKYSIIPGDDDLWWLAYSESGVVVVPDSVAPVPGADS